MKVAILDDYQNVALSFADWDSLDAEIEVVHRTVRRRGRASSSGCAGFDVLVAMRERTPVPGRAAGAAARPASCW